MTHFQGKLLIKTDCDEAGDYVVPNVLSPRDLVFRPDIGHKLYHHHIHYDCLADAILSSAYNVHGESYKTD